MVNLTNMILNKLYEDYRIPFRKNEGVSYLLNKYIENTYGASFFNDGFFRISSNDNGLDVIFSSGDIININVIDMQGFDAIFNFNGETIRSGFRFFEGGFNSSITYKENNKLVEDNYCVVEGVFKKYRKENGNNIYVVSAKSIGYYRSDRASYDIVQEYPPVEYNGVVDRLQDLFNSHYSVNESRIGPSFETYKNLDGLLDLKIEKSRVRQRVPLK